LGVSTDRPATDATPPPARLDDIDRRIIAALQVEGRRPFSRLARDLGVSESSVRYRVKRLEDSGVVQVVGIADPLRIGFDLMALVGLKVQPGRMHEVVERMKALPETSYVAVTAGAFDLIAEVICRETAHFTELLIDRIQGIDGVADTQSFLVLQIHKMAYGWGVHEVATPATTSVVSDVAGST
jgi:Lrp/AsnC family transcriptional regulator, regulator for asnA, asnC and gidA